MRADGRDKEESEAPAAAKQDQNYPQNVVMYSYFYYLKETFMSKKYTSLPPLQGQVFTLLQNNPKTPLSTFELRRHGIASPSQAISKLKNRGIVIE
ncbi:MAG: hypothetical protein DRR42_28160, partial [Gammaproteobacteria bacterium]